MEKMYIHLNEEYEIESMFGTDCYLHKFPLASLEEVVKNEWLDTDDDNKKIILCEGEFLYKDEQFHYVVDEKIPFPMISLPKHLQNKDESTYTEQENREYRQWNYTLWPPLINYMFEKGYTKEEQENVLNSMLFRGFQQGDLVGFYYENLHTNQYIIFNRFGEVAFEGDEALLTLADKDVEQ